MPMTVIAETAYEVPEAQIQAVRALSERVRKMRDTGTLSPEVLGRLRRFFKVKNIYHSNAIEGNVLNVGETRFVVEQGLTLTGKPLKDQAEAKNLAEAIDFLETLATAPEEPIVESDVRQLHHLVLKGINDKESGKYRSIQVEIGGSKFKPPAPESVPAEMATFGDWLQRASVPGRLFSREDAVLAAAAAHTRFVTIHPFIDGNGRVSRLLMNVILMRYTFPIAVITREDRIRYYDALETSQCSDLGPFVQLLVECLEESIEEYELAAKEQRENIEWARSIAGKLDQKETIKATNHYEVWKSAMDLLKSQFKQTADILNASVAMSDVYIKDFGALELEKYLNLKRGVSAKHTWFFRLDIRSGANAARYLFFFGFGSQRMRRDREIDVTLHVAREDPPGSFQYSRCGEPASSKDPDTVEIAYSSKREAFLVRSCGGDPHEVKVDTIVRDMVKQIVERNFGG
jgi:Fic family protein